MRDVLKKMLITWLGTLTVFHIGIASATEFSEAADSCMRPITALQKDTLDQLSLDDRRSMMVYIAWKSTFSSRSEASQKGIDLNVVYDALGISGSSSDQDQKYFQNKEELSINYFTANSSVKFDTLVTRVTSVDAIKAASPNVAHCFKALSESGNFHSCTITPYRNSIEILLTAKYYRPAPELKVSSATARFVKRDGKSRETAVFKKGVKVSPSVIATLQRDPDESVNVNINSSYGSIPCAFVPAIPRYTVSGYIIGLDRRTVTDTEEIALPPIPMNCATAGGPAVTKEAMACASAGQIKAVALSPNTKVNPVTPKDPADCGVVTIKSNNVINGSACAAVTYAGKQCKGQVVQTEWHASSPRIRKIRPSAACIWQEQNGVPITIAATIERSQDLQLPRMEFRNLEMNEGPTVIKYAHATSVKGNANFEYQVTVTDTTTIPSKTVILSDKKPSSDGFSSLLDQAQMTVIVLRMQQF